MDYHTKTLLSLIETKTFYDGIRVMCKAPHEIITDGPFVKPSLQTSGYSTVYYGGVTYLLENLRTGQKRVYSLRAELFREKAIQIPRMDEPFFSKVHEVYLKATPVRGNGYGDITHCGQENTTTTTEKEDAALWSSKSAPHNSIQRIPANGKPMNCVIATCAKAISARSL
jgi:hypothetical protein